MTQVDLESTASQMGMATAEPQPVAARGIASAATVIALGNVASRVLGLVREMVISYLFGATGLVSAFDAASRVPRMLFDLLIDGLVSSALVPVFSELAERDRAELWRVASIMLSLATVVMSGGALLLELFAPQAAWLIVGGFKPELLAYTARWFSSACQGSPPACCTPSSASPCRLLQRLSSTPVSWWWRWCWLACWAGVLKAWRWGCWSARLCR
jgi:hypothetical protein